MADRSFPRRRAASDGGRVRVARADLATAHRAGSFSYPLRRRPAVPVGGIPDAAAVQRHRGQHGARCGRCPQAVRRSAERRRLSVYNGIEWELLAPRRDRREVAAELGLRDGDIVLGTSGNLRDWKRVDLLVRALQKVDDNVVLLVVGDGPERQPLRRLAGQLAVSERTRFVGSTENVADYLQVMQLFALPSGAEESFGNSAVEAMGFGLPTIVMRDGGGLTEHIVHEETGVVAESPVGSRPVDRTACRGSQVCDGSWKLAPHDAIRARYYDTRNGRRLRPSLSRGREPPSSRRQSGRLTCVGSRRLCRLVPRRLHRSAHGRSHTCGTAARTDPGWSNGAPRAPDARALPAGDHRSRQ